MWAVVVPHSRCVGAPLAANFPNIMLVTDLNFLLPVCFAGFLGGICRGLVGLGDALFQVIGWNICFLVYKDQLHLRPEYGSYDVLTVIVLTLQCSSVSFMNFLMRDRWCLPSHNEFRKKLVFPFLLGNTMASPVGAICYRIFRKDVGAVRNVIALFFFGFVWARYAVLTRWVSYREGRAVEQAAEEVPVPLEMGAVVDGGGEGTPPRRKGEGAEDGDVAHTRVGDNTKTVVDSSLPAGAERASFSPADAPDGVVEPEAPQRHRDHPENPGGSWTGSAEDHIAGNEQPQPGTRTPADRRAPLQLDEVQLASAGREEADRSPISHRSGEGPTSNSPPNQSTPSSIVPPSSIVAEPDSERSLGVAPYIPKILFPIGLVAGFLFGLVGVGGPPYALMTLTVGPADYPPQLARLVFPMGSLVEVWIRWFFVWEYADWRKYGLVGGQKYGGFQTEF